MSTNEEMVEYATEAMYRGLILRTHELTAGQYHQAVGDQILYALYVDRNLPHGRTKGQYLYPTPDAPAWQLVDRYGRGETRKIVEEAYRRVGMTPPAPPSTPKKRPARRGRARSPRR